MLDGAHSKVEVFFPEERPWVDRDDHVNLLASRCEACGATAFPPKLICHACGSDRLWRFELSERGAVYTFSEVHTAPPLFETPYIVGYVDFPEGVRAFGQIERSPNVAIGEEVRAHLATVRRDGACNPVVSFKFRSAAK